MKNLLKQSTAKTVRIGPFIDDTDGKTAETSLTISQGDIRLSKDGGAFAQTNNSAGATHDEKGYYAVPLDTTDTNTLGMLTVAVHEAGALPVFREFEVVTANRYDSLIAGSASLTVDVVAISGDTTAADTLELFVEAVDQSTGQLDSGSLASGTITATSIAADAITAAKIADGAIDAATFAADVDAEILGYIVDDATRIDASSLNAAAVTTIPAILVDTAEIGAAGAGLTALASQTSVNTIDDLLDTEVGAIKAKTDLIPASPAAVGDAMTLAASTDTYWATVDLTVDDSNTQDEYTVTWFKNGIRQTSGITTPLIQIVKRSDGSDLVSSTAMTQIASTGSYKYDASGSERLTAGEASLCVVTATMDGSARSFSKLVSRDSV